MKNNLRQWVGLGLFALTTCLPAVAGAAHPPLCNVTPTAPSPTQPNIVVIMVDDLDVMTFQHGLAAGLFPNIKTYLVDQGLTFSRFYVTNSLCCPSRATFLKGQYSHNHPFKSNNDPQPVIEHMHDCDTLPVKLQARGYRTSLIGKYLSLYGLADLDQDGVPPRNAALQPLDMNDLTAIPPGWNDWAGFLDPFNFAMYGYQVNDNGQHTVPSLGIHQTDYVRNRALQFIDQTETQDDSAPFFLALMPTTPHVEATPGTTDWHEAMAWDITPALRYRFTSTLTLPQTPSFAEADVSDKPQWLQDRDRLTDADKINLNRHYGNRIRTMRSIDDLVGALILKLIQRQELSRTVILFTSDNGFLLGQHGLTQKLYAYEESIRVPLQIRLPQGTTAPALTQFVLNNDLAPTILELAGAPIPSTMDGTSLVPLLSNPQVDWRRRFLVEHIRASDSFLEVPSYKAVRTSPADTSISELLYVEYDEAEQTPELYDLHANDDPFQLASKHNSQDPGRLYQMQTLRGIKDALATCTGATCRAIEFCGDGLCAARP